MLKGSPSQILLLGLVERQALEKVWAAGAEDQEEKEESRAKAEDHYDNEEEESNTGKTLTGKKAAKVSVDPKLSTSAMK